MPFPYVFTFYSYKGGVGRSMALLNVAYTLVSRGRHVLVVDMDLEAPGVSGFLHRNEELGPASGAHPKDVLTLLGLAMDAVRQQRSVEDLPPASDFLRPVTEAKREKLKPKLGKVGRLDVIGADQERNYLDRLASLRLSDLTQEELTGVSRLLNRYFKAQRFPFQPFGADERDPPQDTPYDYVLVDSRTGITEVGGLCVGPLADRLVVITGLNDQNVDGTRRFLKEAGIELAPRARNAEAWDEADDPAASSLGPKPTLVVASPVPIGEVGYKRTRLKELEKQIGMRPLSLSYHPQLALMESIFVRDYPEEVLTVEYRQLTGRLMEQVDDGENQLMNRFWSLRQKEQSSKAIAVAFRVAPGSVEAGPVAIEVILNWGNELSNQANQIAGAEADRLFAEAGQKYEAAHRLKPGDSRVLNNWGIALSEQATQKDGAEADRLFAEAGQKYRTANRLNPEDTEIFNNWGSALGSQAKQKSGAEADRLFAEAVQKYCAAYRLNPRDSEMLNNWGAVLSRQAMRKVGAEADRLFAEANQKYAAAHQLKPEDLGVLNNWGAALSEQAKQKAGAEANRLLREAGQKYEAAHRLKPDELRVLNNWGAVLIEQAKQETGAEAARLFADAEQKLLAAEALVPGAGAYNLACLASLRGHASAALEQLRRVPKEEGLTQHKLFKEEDFEPIRQDPAFQAFLRTLPLGT